VTWASSWERASQAVEVYSTVVGKEGRESMSDEAKRRWRSGMLPEALILVDDGAAAQEPRGR
jgi:hypothetical protein